MSPIDLVKNSTELSDDAKKNIIDWLSGEKFAGYSSELEAMIEAGEWTRLEDNFFRILPFGTGGRRGTVGVGSNRVNKVTIGEACQAMSDYLKHVFSDELEKGVVIAYDSRNTSVEFSRYAATVFAANGLTCYLFDDVRSTPELSFAVRNIGCLGGVVISASHNPSSDNGIKVYWRDGGQVVPPHDYELLLRCESTGEILSEDYSGAVEARRIILVGAEQDEAYFAAVLDQSQGEGLNSAVVAYSPLHGAGMSSVYPTLRRAGFTIHLEESQSTYDGNFTNVTNQIPNPEVPAANDRVSVLALEVGADIAITNDPDADRLCVLAVHDGKVVQLNGNQCAALTCDFLLKKMTERGEIGERDFIAKTIVTTELLESIAEKYGVKCRGNLLVGFKYIGELIHLYEDKSNERFLFGGEESYGALVSSYCRDKDAAGSSLLAAQLASELKNQGKTLLDRLDEIYTEHGYFDESLEAIVYAGASGFHAMAKCMDSLRKSTPSEIGGLPVTKVRDYITGEEIEGRVEDVLRFEFSEDGRNRVTIRPSGTEPKIKLYIQTYQTVESDLSATKMQAAQKISDLSKVVGDLVRALAE